MGKCFMLPFKRDDHHLLNTGSCERESNILELLERDIFHSQISLWLFERRRSLFFWPGTPNSKSAARQVVWTTGCNWWFCRRCFNYEFGLAGTGASWSLGQDDVLLSGQNAFDTETLTLTVVAGKELTWHFCGNEQRLRFHTTLQFAMIELSLVYCEVYHVQENKQPW